MPALAEHQPQPAPVLTQATTRIMRISFLAWATLASIVAAALVTAYLLLWSDGERQPGTPFAASAQDLQALSEEAGAPIYWAGTRSGTRLEVTRTNDDKLYVRYLPQSAPIGDERPEFLTVGTYPYPDAYRATSRSVRRPDTVGVPALDDELVAWSKKRPGSVYIARRGEDVLVEVFSADPEQAQRLALDGSISAVR